MKLEKPIFLISTRADKLAKAVKDSPKTVTVWIRTGPFKYKLPLIRSVIVYEAKSKPEAKDYTKRFVSVLTIPKTHTKLSILKDISSNQVLQLLTYTKRDGFIRTRTHDYDFFKNKKSFLAWKVRGKVIYSLINRRGKLFGLIWFNKKRANNPTQKPTVRIYQHARGKGLRKKFKEIVLTNYKLVH